MSDSLRILHCLRAPLGGLFRHVCDLAEAQSNKGHQVGIICDSSTGGHTAESALNQIEPFCKLGISRVAMSRQLGPRDVTAYLATQRLAQSLDLDIIHGHGAKGGALARVTARRLRGSAKSPKSFYTPHGGSLHYGPDTLAGRVFLFLEKRLNAFTDGIIFESQYSSTIFDQKIGAPDCESRVIPNGLRAEEFFIAKPDAAAPDFLFIGELRELKGVHILLEALSILNENSPVSAAIVGSGPDEQRFIDRAKDLGLEQQVTFPGRLPARDAFKLGKCLVIPSLAESFPYIVLEAAAAQKPLIVTNVGGIPEIIGDTQTPMILPDDTDALVKAMTSFRASPEGFAHQATTLQTRVKNLFTVENMADAVLTFYREATR